MMEKKPTLQPFLIVGRKNSGKTHFLLSIAARLRSQGLRTGGVVSIGEFANGAKQRYYLQDLETGRRKLLARKDLWSKCALRQGSYFFNREIFEWANQTLINKLDYDAIIIDEYGPLESKETGLFPAFDFLLQNYHGMLFVAVRPTLASRLSILLEKVGMYEKVIIHLNERLSDDHKPPQVFTCHWSEEKRQDLIDKLFNEGIDRPRI